MSSTLLGGRYELLDLLGFGGMGEVYRAHDKLSDGIVALKRINRKLRDSREDLPTLPLGPGLDDQQRATLLMQTPGRWSPYSNAATPERNARLSLATEFRVLSTLRHPNIVDVLDYGFESSGKPFFTMTLLAEAQTVVNAGKNRPLDERIQLLFQVLQALSYLHRHGVLHRDLKASNVLVVGDHVTVLDFGLSRRGSKTVAGTPGYMAPELYQGAKPSEASDLYAFGVIAYHMLTGSRAPVLRIHAPWVVYDLRSIENAAPFGVIMARLLSESPSARYDSADRLMTDLAEAAQQKIPPEPVAVRESCLKAAPFAGRRKEISVLLHALREAIHGKGSAWFLAGESGVGKSRLLEDLRSRALVRGVFVLSGTADDNSPFSAFRSVILRLALVVEPSDEEAAILKLFFPEVERLLAKPVGTVEHIDPATFSDRLAGVVTDLFVRYGQPVLLQLEDLHLARESLKLLNRIIDVSPGHPILVIGAYRDDERPSLPSELPEAKVIHIQRLTHAEIREMGSSILGPQLGANEAIMAFLERETEGNAFFVVEALRALAERQGALALVSPEALPRHVFPSGMKDAVRRRLERLPHWAVPLLQTAALIGREFDSALLRQGADSSRVDSFLQLASGAGIIQGDGYNWQFTHDKLREGVVADLNPESARGLHRSIALAIEALHGASVQWTQALARHWKLAGDRDKASRYLLAAAEQFLLAGVPAVSVQLAIEGLEQLGVEVPSDPEKLGVAIGAEAGRIAQRLGATAPTDLLELPELSDNQVARILRILKVIQPSAHISRQAELFAFTTCKCVSLTLEHGLSQHAPQGFATYGAVLRTVTGNAPLAVEWGNLAVALDMRLYGRVSSPVAFLHGWFLNHWCHPVRTSLDLAQQGADAGLASGDVLYGCFNAAAYVIYLNAAGATLAQVCEAANERIAAIDGRVYVAKFHCLLERQLAAALMDQTEHPLTFSDSEIDEERDLASICTTANFNQIAYYWTAKLRLNYLFGEYREAQRYAGLALPIFTAFQGQVLEWQFQFYRALTALALAAVPGSPDRAALLEVGREIVALFDSWSSWGQENFVHKRDLLRAELFVARRRHDLAAPLYRAAAVSALEAGFVPEAALAYERLSAVDRQCRSRARELYRAWGATAKSRHVA